MSAPDVTIVVVSYNTRELLDRCLEKAATDSPGVSREIRVVDNASSDGSPEWIARRWPQVILEANRENRGYAPACNQALRAARGRWVLTLNSDAFLHEGALGTLVRYLEGHPGIAAAGPRLLNADGTTQRVCARRAPTFLSEYLGATLLPGYLPRLVPFVRRHQPDAVYETDGEIEVLSGACILFRRAALEQAGLLDERLVLSYDDVEWSLRARRLGLHLAYVPAARVTHLGGGSRCFDAQFNSAGSLEAAAVFWDIRFPAPAALLLKLTMTANVALSLAKNLVLAPVDRARRPKVTKRLELFRRCLGLLGRASRRPAQRPPRAPGATLVVACFLASAAASASGTAPSPRAVEEPRVEAAAVSPAADSITPAGARYVALARLETLRVPEGEPWAPDRPVLALVKREGLFLFDAERPSESPRRILETQVIDVRWSPDGSYLACRVRVPTAARGGAVRLQLVPAAGGTAAYRIPPARIGACIWAEDGWIYYWDVKSGGRGRLEPPRDWRASAPPLPPARPHLVLVPVPGQRQNRVVRFSTGSRTLEVEVPALAPRRTRSVWIGESFTAPPGATRFLVRIQDLRAGVTTAIVDSTGARRAVIGEQAGLPSFVGTSVASDGRWIAGHRPKGAARTLEGSELWIADTGGRWSIRVDGAANAVEPRLARSGSYVVFEEAGSAADVVHVGRLEVRLPEKHAPAAP
jgi:hypothetical protein